MAFKINRNSRTDYSAMHHGEWLLGLTDDYIKETAQEQMDLNLNDDQCLEVAEWIEDNMFDIIIQACEELAFDMEEDDE